MSGRRWSVRKGGVEMTTVQFRLHIPKSMVEFVTEHSDMSETKAVAWLRERYYAAADDERELVVAFGEHLMFEHGDHTAEHPEDYLVYEGPKAVVTFP